MLDVCDDAGALPGSDVGDAAKEELAVGTGELVDDTRMDGQAEVAGALLLVVLELSLVECDVAGVFLCADGEDGVWGGDACDHDVSVLLKVEDQRQTQCGMVPSKNNCE